MSTHNICFYEEVKKKINIWLKLNALSRAMDKIVFSPAYLIYNFVCRLV